MSPSTFIAVAALAIAAQAQAQPLPTTGTLVVVPAFGEVTRANDQAVITFSVEEQDKDKAAAASRVNQKMKQGTEIVRKEDPQAQLKTQGYYTYPVYPEDRPIPAGTPPKPRVPAAWRVGQSLEVKTTNLVNLPKTAAAAQKVLALNHLQFGLSPAATKKLDGERIKVGDAVLDTVDFEGSGNYAGQQADMAAPQMMRAMAKREQAEVAEPSFEPGETTLQMRLVGKVKFK